MMKLTLKLYSCSESIMSSRAFSDMFSLLDLFFLLGLHNFMLIILYVGAKERYIVIIVITDFGSASCTSPLWPW